MNLSERPGHYPAEVVNRVECGSLLPTELFVEQYPYLLRYCQNNQLKGEQFILDPQAGEFLTYGVFFYALECFPQEIKSQDRVPLLVKTADLISKVDSARQIFTNGILLIPSVFYKQLSDKLFQQSIQQGKGVMTAGFEAQEIIYKEWAVLNETKIDLGMQPVLSIPARMQIGREYSLI